LTHQLIKSISNRLVQTVQVKTVKLRHGGSSDEVESPGARAQKDHQQRTANDKKQFEKRYTHLMLMLINAPEKENRSS
jgi:hypothetical protein